VELPSDREQRNSSLVPCRSSENLMFSGENKPTVGSSRDGQLKLLYYQDPGVKEGDVFPLWTIQ
jgi:hypothetical protein